MKTMQESWKRWYKLRTRTTRRVREFSRWLIRIIVRPFAEPQLNIRENYQKVRRRQRRLAIQAVPQSRLRDYLLSADDGSHEIPIRVFQPREQTRDLVILFFHGGGWVTGGIESYTPACHTMADLTGCVVASVEYRLAPEHPFPAGLDDCYTVARRVLMDPSLAGIEDASKVVLMGDSSGGNLVASLSLQLKQRNEPVPARQILLYPVTHWNHDPRTSPFESVRQHGEDYRLTNSEVNAYFDMYAPDPELRKTALISPLVADDLSEQPKTLVITAELDLLCDEGERYAEALEAAGNEVHVYRVDRALHGFINLPRFARSLREAYDVINQFLSEPQGQALK